MLNFLNPGEIDPRLITTFGANVKESDSPIGFFGTGLKYAIAVTLRLGGRLEIYSGLRKHIFTTREESIRSKAFSMVYMDDAPASFTLELGKRWEPWMAYREFYSNMLDERGAVTTASIVPAAGQTLISVDCREIEHAHRGRSLYFLDRNRKPLAVHDGVEIYHGVSSTIFYRGIAIEKLAKPSLFTYNILSPIELTEDRTSASPWSVQYKIAGATAKLDDVETLSRVLQAGDETYEGKNEYNWVSPSTAFLEVGAKLIAARQTEAMPKSAIAAIVQRKPELTVPKAVDLNVSEMARISETKEFCRRLGYPITAEVKLSYELASNVIGCVHGGQIYLAPKALSSVRECAGTMIEEQIHISTGAADNSRQMQEALLNIIMVAGEKFAEDR